MKPLFASAELQEKFTENGFVKIPLLNAEEVSKLLADYETVKLPHEAIGIPYITTSHSNNADLIAKVDGFLQQTLAPAIHKHLINHQLLFGNFLVKMPTENSETSPHQDITFVDETQYVSVNIWVALQDADEHNGCMYFLPGSHRFIHTLRPTHSYPWAYQHVANEIKKHVHSFPVRAGDAFVFHHGVVHGSYSNTSTKPRVAAVMAAYHADAPLLHYYLPEGKGNKVQKYGMTKEAFLSFVKNNPPAEGVFMAEETYDFHQLNVQEFNGLFQKKAAPKNGVISKLFKLFS